MKQAKLNCDDRALRQKIVELPADRAKVSHAASLRSDSNGADRPIPRGIAILIDLLAHEALKEVIAEHSRKEARDDERQKTAQSGKPNEAVIAGPAVIKTKSCPRQDPRQTDLVTHNQTDTKIKSGLLAAGGRFDLCITHPLRLPIMPASLTHCPH